MNIENVHFSAGASQAILKLALKVELKTGQQFRATKSLYALSKLYNAAAVITDQEVRAAYTLFQASLSPGQYAALSAHDVQSA